MTTAEKDKCRCGKSKDVRYPLCYTCNNEIKGAGPAAQASEVGEAQSLAEMGLEETVSYHIDGRRVELAIKTVQIMFPGINASALEAYNFTQVCCSTGLDPRRGECSLIRYQTNGPATPHFEIAAYVRRARRDPTYLRYKSGVVVLRSDQLVMEDGAFVAPGDTLLGGWCTVLFQDGAEHTEKVSLDGAKRTVKETNPQTGEITERPRALWGEDEPMMVQKAAIRTTLRHLWPDIAGELDEWENHNLTERQRIYDAQRERNRQSSARVVEDRDIGDLFGGPNEPGAGVEPKAEGREPVIAAESADPLVVAEPTIVDGAVMRPTPTPDVVPETHSDQQAGQVGFADITAPSDPAKAQQSTALAFAEAPRPGAFERAQFGQLLRALGLSVDDATAKLGGQPPGQWVQARGGSYYECALEICKAIVGYGAP